MRTTEQHPVRVARADRKAVDVARQAGISPSLLSMIERGYIPSAATRLRLAPVLGRTVEQLWPNL